MGNASIFYRKMGLDPRRGWRKEWDSCQVAASLRAARCLKITRSARTERSEGLAERVGFEPTVRFPVHTLSKRAPSTTRTSLRL